MTGAIEAGSLRSAFLNGVREYSSCRAAAPPETDSEWRSGIPDAVDLSDGSRRAVLVSTSREIVPSHRSGRPGQVAQSGVREEAGLAFRGSAADIPSVLARYRSLSGPADSAPLVDLFV